MLTQQQQVVLNVLKRRADEGSLSTHQIGDELRRALGDSPHGYYDRAHATLVRLEARGLVTRIPGKPGSHAASWLPTNT